jgi:hypothetical protein
MASWERNQGEMTEGRKGPAVARMLTTSEQPEEGSEEAAGAAPCHRHLSESVHHAP